MAFILPAAASALSAGAGAAAATAATAAATTTLTSTLVSVASQVALNLAVSAVMSALSPQVGAAGRPVEWTLNPDGPIPFAFGRVGVAGSVVHKRTFGPDKMYYGFVSVLSGAGPIQGFESFTADDQPVTFDSAGKAVSSEWANEMWRVTRTGTQPSTFLPTPTGLRSNAQLPGWTSAHKLSGKAASMLVMGENSKRTAYPNGEVKPLEVIRGLFCWDPRQDDTWPGGSGLCRLDQPSTWVWVENPIIFGLKWSLGLWEGPTGKGAPQVDHQVGGIGAKLSGIDVPAFIAAANVADANGWTCGAYPTTDDDKNQVLNAFLQAGGAVYAQRAGKISCIQRAAPRASVVTIAADDVVGALEIDTAASRIDRINTIRPRYWSPEHRWQLTAIDEVTAEAYRTEDGGKRTRGIDYPYVTSATQAAQLAALDIANTREGIAGVVPLKPHLQRIRPGDAFTITEPGFVLDGVKCLCLNADYDPATGIVSVTFVSETDGKYAFALGQSAEPPVPPTLTADTRTITPPGPNDWTVEPLPPAPGGGQLSGFEITGGVDNATATGLIVEAWRVPEDANPTFPPDPVTAGFELIGIYPPTTTRLTVTGFQPGETYWLSFSHRRNERTSLRTLNGPHTAPALIANLNEADAASLARIGVMDSDNVLSRGRKSEVMRTWAAIVGEYPATSAQALASGATAQRAALIAAYDALSGYLSSLSPAYNNVTTDTPINGATFRQRFADYFAARTAAVLATIALAQADADAAAFDASAALNRLGIIQSDAWLSRDEKPEVIRLWAAIHGEYPGLDTKAGEVGTPTEQAAYTTAYTALSNYLSGLSPAWNDAAQDTAIDGPAFAARFSSYYTAKQALLNAMMGRAAGDASLALGRLAIIQSDGHLSRGEKPEVVRQWQSIVAEYPGLAAQALAVDAPVARGQLVAKYQALSSYLAGLSPAYDDVSQDTAIDPAVFAARFTEYHAARQALVNAMIGVVGADASTALARLTIIQSDGWLSRNEKPDLVREWGAIVGEYPGLSAQGLAIGATAQRAALIAAYDALSGYLSSLSPAYNDATSDTAIDPSLFTARFTAYYSARQALVNAMIGVVGDSASAALGRLAIIQSDAHLSRDEKPEILRQWQAIIAEYPGVSARALASGATAQRNALIAAYTALSSYLSGLSPAYDDTAADTVIDPLVFAARFSAYYAARAEVWNATIGLAQADADQAAADASTALGRITTIQSDAILSRGEKPEVIRQWAGVQGEYDGLVARATAQGITAEKTAYTTAFVALSDYLSSLTPGWNDTTADTPIDPATFASRFSAYYVAKQALLNALLGQVAGDASAALGRIAIIQSDGHLSRDEKPEVMRQWAVIVAEYPGISAQALGLGQTTARAALIAAYDALSGYLSGLSPPYNDTAQDTVIDGPTFRARFADYYVARQTCLNAMLGAVGSDAASALQRVSRIGADGFLARDEKADLNREWQAIIAEYPSLAAQALATGAMDARNAYVAKYNALSAYLSGLSPAYDDATVDTPIVAATFNARFVEYYGARQAVISAMVGVVGSDASAALGRLGAIQADGVLAREEKPEIIRQWAAIHGEQPGISAQALALGVTAPRTTYNNAYVALSDYLSGLSPAWNSLAADSPIDGATFTARFRDYYVAKQALINALTGADIQANRIVATSLSAITASLGTVTSGKVQSPSGSTYFDLTAARQQFEVGGYVWRQGAIGSTVVCWFGPAGVAVGSETRTNGAFAFGTDGVIYRGDAPLNPGGGGDVDLPNDLGQVRSGSGTAAISGAAWQTLFSATLTGVVVGQTISAAADLTSATTGNNLIGEVRLVQASDGAVLYGPAPVSYQGGQAGGDDQLSLFGAATTSGSVTYRVEARQSGGDYWTGASGQWSIARLSNASPTAPGYMSAEQAAQLAALVASGGGGGGGGGAALSDAIPTAPGAASAGTATTASRGDHRHPPPSVATSTTAGLISAADQARLNETTGVWRVGGPHAVRMVQDGTGAPGYVDFLSSGERRGYIGYKGDGDRLMLGADGAWAWAFDKTPYVGTNLVYHAGNLAAATASAAGLMSAADKSKLNEIAPKATANDSNANLRARSSHTGTQPASTITGLGPAATAAASVAVQGNTVALRNGDGYSEFISLLLSSGIAYLSNYGCYIWGNGGRIDLSHATYAPSFNQTSDSRTKTDIEISPAGALDRIAAMRVVDYTRIKDGGAARGFLAEDLAAIDPIYAVESSPPAPPMMGPREPTPQTPLLALDVMAVLADAVAAIQELRAEVAHLRSTQGT